MCCVMVSQYVQIQDRRHVTVTDITFRGPYTSRNSRDYSSLKMSGKRWTSTNRMNSIWQFVDFVQNTSSQM